MTGLAQWKKIRLWQRNAERRAPKPGDTAPDFILPELSGEELISLSDFRGKLPVALIFGSHT